MASVIPTLPNQFFDNNGDPLAGGKVYTYEAGTTTPKTTWSDAAETTPNANPIILDSGGRATIYWSGSYKVVVHASDDTLVTSVDDVAPLDTLRTDLANSTDVAKGDALVTVKRSDSNSIATTQHIVNEQRPIYVTADFGALGNGTTDDRASFSTADTSSGTTELIYVSPGTYRIASNLTLNGHYFFAPGAKLKPDASVTVTMNGSVIASAYQIFDLSNSNAAITGPKNCSQIFVDWFGAVGDAATDNTKAFKSAITAAGLHGGTVYIPAGTYSINTPLTFSEKVKLIGAGKGATRLLRNFSGATDAEGLLNFTTYSGSVVKDMQIYSASGTTGGCLISMVASATAGSPDFMVFENLYLTYGAVDTYKYAVYVNGASRTDNIGVRDTAFVNCEVFGGANGSMYLDTVVSFRFTGAMFAAGSTSGKLVVDGSGANKSFYLSVDATSLDGLLLQNIDYANIKAGVIVNQITNAASARYVSVTAAAAGGYQEFWTDSHINDTSKMGITKSAQGSTILSNGLKLQWDTVSASTAWQSKTFHTSFATACVSVVGNTVDGSTPSIVQFKNISTSGYDVITGAGPTNINIFAIGY